MQTIPSLTAVALALSILGCTHEISNEERLDRETSSGPVKESPGATDLAKINCQDATAGLAKARNENRPETDRLVNYNELYETLKKKTETFELAFSRNPDLAYQEGNTFVEAKDLCVQQTADVRVEFERYVRDLVKTPVVDEVRGGNTVKVARLDFSTLRMAIETLSPDDKDQLLARVANAEKTIQSHPDDTKRHR
jgi:hypothetical protein